MSFSGGTIFGMSTAGDTDSVFSDAECGQTDDTSRRKRERQQSITELISSYEKRQKKGKSPKGKSPTGKADLPVEILSYIKEIIEATIESSMEGHMRRLEKVMKTKQESQKKRIELLEGESFEKTEKIDSLQQNLSEAKQRITVLEDQVDAMERHQRGVNLVVSCRRLGKQRVDEDIRGELVKLLRESFPHIPLTRDSFSAAHRLPGDGVVICAFRDRDLRDRFYQERLSLRRVSTPHDHRIYISESLTPKNREIFGELLTMRRKQRVWTVFTNSGIPGYKLTRDSPSMRVTSLQQVRDLWRKLREARETAHSLAPGSAPVPPVQSRVQSADFPAPARPRSADHGQRRPQSRGNPQLADNGVSRAGSSTMGEVASRNGTQQPTASRGGAASLVSTGVSDNSLAPSPSPAGGATAAGNRVVTSRVCSVTAAGSDPVPAQAVSDPEVGEAGVPDVAKSLASGH